MILVSINFDYLIVSIAFALLFMLYSLVIKPKYENKEIKALLTKVASEKGYTFEVVNNASYDYILKNANKKLLIKVVKVPKVSAITINSKSTWSLTYGGSGAPGKAYLNQKYLNELVPFLNMKTNNDELKVILVYKQTDKVQRYLNESEIDLIKVQDLVYDYKVITFRDFASHFEEL